MNPFKKRVYKDFDVDSPEKGSERDNIQWKIGVVYRETGLRVEVDRARTWTNGVEDSYPRYQISVGGYSTGTYDFHGVWTFLNGISFGARAVKQGQ